ncbi:MAG: response regulator [Desulfitobacteriaceae bacterium]
MARILIVDDSTMMRRNLSQIIQNKGHIVVAEATNGLQAFTEYQIHKPDLVTMDITMPVVDGIEAVEKIITKFPDAKIIMISSINQREKIFEALKKGAKNYIVKPFNSEKVTQVINLVLNINDTVIPENHLK